MSFDRRRYSRQIRLADVGEAGQAKLCAAEVSLGAEGFARVIEERYVRAAGMRIIDRPVDERPESARPAVGTTALGLRHPPAQEVAEGALAALAAIHGALGLSGSRSGT